MLNRIAKGLERLRTRALASKGGPSNARTPRACRRCTSPSPIKVGQGEAPLLSTTTQYHGSPKYVHV